jgi:sigma-B regulation protein RsbU (phosphoserine phosphatase)
MHQAKKKITFSGSLAWRTSIVCLVFLIAPLLVHTFMLYRQEISIAEADVRSCLKAVGGEIAERISERVDFDWQILDVKYCSATLESAFQIERIVMPGKAGVQFAALNEKGDALRVGKFVSEREAKVISHPLKEILFVQDPPFPIDIGFNQIKPIDQWVERFSIPDTQLSLVLGTSNERIYELQTKHFIFRIASFVALVMLLGGGLVILLVRRLEKPLKALCLTMRRVGEGAVHSRYVPRMWGFEINSIGLMFNETLDEMLARSAEMEEERMKRGKLAQELKLGHEIQASLLPKKFPSIQNIEISAGCTPAHEVGGDFYDIFPLGSNKTLIAVADVAGKGISACLFSLGLRSSLRALAANVDSLSEIIKKANELFLIDAEESSQFATLWIGIIEKTKLHFVSLGHPPALFKRGVVLKELTSQNLALGVMPYESIRISSIDLEEGDEILIFSDGATESMDAEGNLYGIDRLKEAFLRSNKPDRARELLNKIQLFTKGAIQHDDLTLLYLRIS